MQLTTESSEEAPFQVELEGYGTSCRLIMRGDLCETSIAVLEAKVDQLGCMPCKEVTVDLHCLTKLDTVGANVILGLYHYVVGRGGTLRMTRPSDQVAAMLHSVTGSVIPLATPESSEIVDTVAAPLRIDVESALA